MEPGKPDYKGRYWCPYKCGDPSYPQPHWKTEKGFLGHLAKCPNAPLVLPPEAAPPPPAERRLMATCECGRRIIEGDMMWEFRGSIVRCFECAVVLPDRGPGHFDFAGLNLGDADYG